MKIDEWSGCYPSSWKGVIVPEAMVHPAKFSSKLIQHIYEHLRDEGWIEPGDSVIDPFGGVALGALHAMLAGLNWYGCELEEKFWKLGSANIEKWRKDFRVIPHLGTAQLFHGDSRRLLEVIGMGGVGVEVSSPPYADSINSDSNGIDWEKSTKDYPGRQMTPQRISSHDKYHNGYNYGSTPGQLGAMKANGFDVAIKRFDSEINIDYNSPYAEKQTNKSLASNGRNQSNVSIGVNQLSDSREIKNKSSEYSKAIEENGSIALELGSDQERIQTRDIGKTTILARKETAKRNGNSAGEENQRTESLGMERRQGETRIQERGSEGDLRGMWNSAESLHSSQRLRSLQQQTREPSSSMRELSSESAQEGILGSGESGQETTKEQRPDALAQAIVSSPPYTPEALGHSNGEGPLSTSKNRRDYQEANTRNDAKSFYGDGTEGNLGNGTSDDFWLAARQIVEQVYIALRPGGHAVWVCKDYVKNKQRMPFCDQWRQLCEAVGFETLHEHHALLVRNKRTQIDLEGNHHELQSESKSFFRRLAEKKGSPRIDFECVYCMVKKG